MKEKRDNLDYLQDILSMIDKVEEFTEDRSLEEFEESEMVHFAVIRAHEVMGIRKSPGAEWPGSGTK